MWLVARFPAPPVLAEWERELYDRTATATATATASAVADAVADAPPTPVHRELADGDRLDWGAGARVPHVPGHTPGSIAVHLPEQGVLFTGDTIASRAGRPIPGVFNTDRVQLAAACTRLAALDIGTALFGHGEPLTGDAGAALRAAAP